MPDLPEFYRNGQPIPLTSMDYANRKGISLYQARVELTHLARSGAISCEECRGHMIFELNEARP